MGKENRKYNFRDALGRLQKAFQVLTQAQIAETLGVSKGSVNACIQRETVPDSWIVCRIFSKKGGHGIMVLARKQPTHEGSHGQEEVYRIRRRGKVITGAGGRFLKATIKKLVQEALEAEMEEALQAAKSERNENRLGYRSGYYRRSLITRIGKLE